MSIAQIIRPLVLSLTLALASTAAFADGNDIDKVNGSITAESGQRYGDVSTVNGSIKLLAGTQVGDAETVNGSVKADDDITADSMTTVNGSIRVGQKARIGGQVETVNGSIFIGRGGSVGKGIETVNGGIGIVATELADGIETVNGDITVGVDSHVHGGIKVSKPTSSWLPINLGKQGKPRIIIGPNAVVDGKLVFEREVTLYVHTTARIGTVTGATPVSYDTARAPEE